MFHIRSDFRPTSWSFGGAISDGHGKMNRIVCEIIQGEKAINTELNSAHAQYIG
jgi:hypothetical protein